MADDPQVTITPEEIQRTVAELKTRGVIHAGVDRLEAREAIKRFLVKAKTPVSTAQSIEGGANTVMSSVMRGAGKIVSGELGLMEGSSKLTGGALRAVGLEGLASTAESVGSTAGELGRISDRDLAQAYQPDPHDVIAEPGVGQFLKQTAPGIAGQAAAVIGTGGLAGPAAGVGLASSYFGGTSWNDAKANGATDEQAAGAMMVGLGAGALQATLLGRIALRSPTIMAKLTNAGAMAVTNVGVEGLQDEFAKHTYDPERKVLAGWKENLAGTAVMALVAGVMGGHGAKPKALDKSPEKPPPPFEGDPNLKAGAGDPAAEARAHPDMSGTAPVVEPRQPNVAESVPLDTLAKPVEQGPHPLLSFTEKAIAKDLERARGAEVGKVQAAFGDKDGARAQVYVDKLRKAATPGDPERARAFVELSKLRETLPPETVAALDKPTGRFGLPDLEAAAAAKELRRNANVARYNQKKGIGDVKPADVDWLDAQAKWAERSVGRGWSIMDDAIGMGSRLTREASASIAGSVAGDKLGRALSDPATAQHVLANLQESGVFTRQDALAMSNPDGTIHPAGAEIIQHALLGSLVPNARTIAETPPALRQTLIEELPSLLTLKALWPEFQGVLKNAVEGINSLKGRTIDEALFEGLSGMPEPWMTDTQAVSTMRAFTSDSPNSLARRFQNIASAGESIARAEHVEIFNPLDRTIQSVFGLNMPEHGIQATPEFLEMMKPVEQKRPDLFGNRPAPLGASMLPEDMIAAAAELKVSISDVALAQASPDSIPPVEALPLAGNGTLTEAVTNWDSARNTGKMHARVEEWKARRTQREIVGNRSFKEWVRQTFGHEQREKNVVDLDAAIDHRVELGGMDPEQVKRMAAELTDEEFAPFRQDIERSLDLIPPAAEQADRIRAQNAAEGQQYQDQELIQASRANYTAHLWEWKEGVLNFDNKGMPRQKGEGAKFAEHNARQQSRSFDTTLEGLIEMQRRKRNGDDYAVPRLRGAVTKQRVVREQMSSLIADRNFMESGIKSGFFAPYQVGGDWQLILHKGFAKWFPIGKVSGKNVLITTGDSQLRLNFDGETTVPQTRIKTWGDRIHYNADGSVWMKREMYAPPEVAEKLNNVLGKIAPQDVKWGPFNFTEIDKHVEALRQTILSGDFTMHSRLGLRLMEVAHSWQEANPIAAYRIGRSAMESHSYALRELQMAGAKLTVQSDLSELDQQRATKVGQILDRVPVVREAKAAFQSFRHWQEDGDFGYRKFGTAVKAGWMLLERARLIKENLKLPPDKQKTTRELSAIVARTANDAFTGQNLVARNRNPIAQKVANYLLMAPQWLEGNLHLAVKSIPRNPAVDPLERRVYQRLMAGAIVRAGVASIALRAMMASIASDDDKAKHGDVWDRLKADWEKDKTSILDVNITPLYDRLGGHDGGDKYLSLMGRMEDGYRMLPFLNPEFGWAWKGKMGVIPHWVTDFFYGPFKGGRLTTTQELLGLDDRGTYDKVSVSKTGQVKMPGMEKGKSKKGQLTTPGFPAGPVGIQELWTYMAYEARGSMPIPAQNMLQAVSGERRWLDAVLSGMLFDIRSGKKDKK